MSRRLVLAAVLGLAIVEARNPRVDYGGALDDSTDTDTDTPDEFQDYGRDETHRQSDEHTPVGGESAPQNKGCAHSVSVAQAEKWLNADEALLKIPIPGDAGRTDASAGQIGDTESPVEVGDAFWGENMDQDGEASLLEQSVEEADVNAIDLDLEEIDRFLNRRAGNDVAVSNYEDGMPDDAYVQDHELTEVMRGFREMEKAGVMPHYSDFVEEDEEEEQGAASEEYLASALRNLHDAEQAVAMLDMASFEVHGDLEEEEDSKVLEDDEPEQDEDDDEDEEQVA
eukprot:TRINITY_DN46727_c0_g1_i1.p1 TRINITY_DN46727_c0_g1~~TRINITY_DN46727_c0_g1_i1.p1  ORF type:complete len:284 (+),score=72.74 TRINITY_DN46727_c0_g1_i1:160-1011(+)